MSSTNGFAEKGHAHEEEYFRRREQELVAEARGRAAREVEMRRLAETTGISDEDTLREIWDLGFTHQTVELLYLLPVVEVAWAEDVITGRERDILLDIGASRDIAPGTPAGEMLGEWLENRPSRPFFARGLWLASELLRALPESERRARREEMLACCADVAAASGGIIGFLGLGERVSREERTLIDRIDTATAC